MTRVRPLSRLSLRLRVSLVAAVVAAGGMAVLATVGLAGIERRLVDDRLDSVAGATLTGGWLPQGAEPTGAELRRWVRELRLDALAKDASSRSSEPRSPLALLLDELRIDPGDPIPLALNTRYAALLGVDTATIVPLATVDGPVADPLLVLELSNTLPELRAGTLEADDVAFDRIPYAGRDLVVGAFVGDIRDLADTMSRWAAVWAPAVVAAVFALAWLLTGRALRPVGAMTGRVATISPDGAREGERLPVPPSGDELARLAERFNALIDQIVAGDLRQRRFTADAGHELRSPLAVIRSEAEQALTPGSSIGRQELAEAVLAETLRLQELVDDMLVLARGDEPAAPARRVLVDVDDLIVAEARRRRGAIDISQVGAAQTPGDPDLLARAFRHVIDNAVRHARERVAVALRTVGGRIVVHVDDDGAGVPEPDRRRIFDRFVRLDAGRSRDAGGAGLGLAVTAAIVRAHGGSIAVEDAPLGGARLVVTLPLAGDEHAPRDRPDP